MELLTYIGYFEDLGWLGVDPARYMVWNCWSLLIVDDC